MSLPFAKRLERIKPSATVAIGQRAAELNAQGVDVISFSLGEPDFEPPAHVIEAAAKALRGSVSKYTAVRGVLPLREAICADSARRRGGVGHAPEEVVVSVGAKHTLFNLAMCLFEPGDEVIVPAPYWVSYPEQVRLCGAEPVIVQTDAEHGFRLTKEALAASVSDRTKALILCTPSNPTGSAYAPAHLQAVAEVAREHAFWIIVDEIYAQLVYDGFEQRSLLEIAPDLRDRIIIVDGVSKTYAMTGWRIGWMLAPSAVAKACDKLQGQSTTNPAAIAQHAALAALEGPPEAVQAMRRTFEGRRGRIVEGLNRIEGIHCRMPEGAFYAFPDVRGLLGRQGTTGVLTTDLDLASYLLEEARCAVVPGSAFGAPGHVRISYAASEALIDEGLARMAAAAAKLG